MHRSDHSPTRTLVLWVPDWPVLAAAQAHGVPADAPIALRYRGMVHACSSAARAEGVRRGLRIREAQARCTSLQVFDHDPALEARLFEPAITRLEASTPGVQVLRPGVCAIRARGVSRYYGGEQAAGLALAGQLAELVPTASAGVADGPFAAEHAARQAGAGRVLVIPPGDSAEFLAPLPVSVLGVPELTGLLQRLGIRTIGAFADLDALDVAERFGAEGLRLHGIASGSDGRRVQPRVPPEEFETTIAFEPAVERIDQAAFAFREPAERFIAQLTAARLVCTALRIELETDDGGGSEREWLHPRTFSPAEVVDRLRWQLQGGSTGSGLLSGLVHVRVTPVSVDSIGNHERALFGDVSDERVHHALSRVQSMLGHEAVLTATIGGGRHLSERAVLVPWGERATVPRNPAQPWPGSLPDPQPSLVFPSPLPVAVFDERGGEVSVDARGALSAPPHRLTTTTGGTRRIESWAGPWPLEERWWDAAAARREYRFQLVDSTGAAWLLVLDQHGWQIEARYD
ncbi:DNA polymerase Y family protein [Ruicaihuangia caeni]|uniref:DNA polymerase Y family protein n=1 Tax=Ruicaihuangia caeni TaxID=3042517 RepID=A0AAW6T667_9MICO|nr:DNA polymerase Y family protein [Klugiella sp. YN-L-19]MDI2098171.1 DNA polymerase Y family protein [Klugiella sp. YN-L-19]